MAVLAFMAMLFGGGTLMIYTDVWRGPAPVYAEVFIVPVYAMLRRLRRRAQWRPPARCGASPSTECDADVPAAATHWQRNRRRYHTRGWSLLRRHDPCGSPLAGSTTSREGCASTGRRRRHGRNSSRCWPTGLRLPPGSAFRGRVATLLAADKKKMQCVGSTQFAPMSFASITPETTTIGPACGHSKSRHCSNIAKSCRLRSFARQWTCGRGLATSRYGTSSRSARPTRRRLPCSA